MHSFWGRWLLIGVGAYLFGKFLFIPLLPFVIALTIAVLLEPMVLWCQKRLSFQRKFAAAALVTALFGVLFFLLGLLCWKLFGEAVGWLQKLPEAVSGIPALTEELERRYRGFYHSCPGEIRLWLDDALTFAAEQGASFAGELSQKAVSAGASLVAALPQLTLFFLTTILAVYFMTLSYPEILAFVRRQIPRKWQDAGRGITVCLRTTFWQWLKAEAILSFVTFLLCLLGFWYLDVSYGLLAAAAVALVDALPVLGAGAVLLPWGVYHLLLGYFPRGVALLALYAVLTIVRGLLEPKVLSAQAGLPPLAGLIAVYLGYALFGVGGMLLMPVLMMFFMQLRRGGYLRLWR